MKVLKFLLLFATISIGFVSSLGQDQDDDSMEDEPVAKKTGNLIPIGDMLLTKHQYNFFYKRDPNKRVGLTTADRQWLNGVVPIRLKEGDFDEEMRGKIQFAMDYIMNVSCIQFKTEFNQTDFPSYVLVQYVDRTCSSQVGFIGGQQDLNLYDKCGKGNIIHELLHTLGFMHMHTAPERDNYVKIITENIKPETISNFEKTLTPVSMFGTLYEYSSIMHYGRFAFQKGNPREKKFTTILPKERATEMGQRRRMTDGDITRLNRMYRCPKFEEEYVEIYRETTTESVDEGEEEEEDEEFQMQQDELIENRLKFPLKFIFKSLKSLTKRVNLLGYVMKLLLQSVQ